MYDKKWQKLRNQPALRIINSPSKKPGQHFGRQAGYCRKIAHLST